jgi:hypothetical protein
MNLKGVWRNENLLIIFLWVGVIGFMVLLALAGWPQYWRFVASETAPLAWLESMLLVLTAFTAILIAYIDGLAGVVKRPRYLTHGWLIVALGFAWLAMDERFAVHERIRDRFLKPTGIKLLPWMEAGDWVIPIYMVCGLAAVWGIWQLFEGRGTSRRFFVGALLLSVCAVMMDTIDVRSLDIGSERLLQSIEEVLETLAMTAFLSAFLWVWMGKLKAMINNT